LSLFALTVKLGKNPLIFTTTRYFTYFRRDLLFWSDQREGVIMKTSLSNTSDISVLINSSLESPSKFHSKFSRKLGAEIVSANFIGVI